MDKYHTIELEFNDFDIEYLPHINLYITSEENSDGILFHSWNDGQEKKLSFDKEWIDHHIWMTLFPEKISYLKKISNCTDRTSYQQFGLKLREIVKHENCTKKCLPSSLRSVIPLPEQDAIPLCETKEEEKCAFLAAQDVRLMEYQKPCSIKQYSGNFGYWTPEADGRTKDNKTFSFGWFFPPPGTVKVQEQYLIYDTIDFTSAIASTLGMFIGFSFSGVVGFAFHCIQIKWLKKN